MAILTGVVGVACRHHAPREFGLEIEECLRAVQVGTASLAGVLGEHGVVETCARVVGIYVEVVVLRVGGAERSEAEVLRLLRGIGHRNCEDRGGQQEEGGEELHYGI